VALPLLASTNTDLGIVREDDAVYWNAGFFGNIDPMLSLLGVEIASVNDGDFVFGEDRSG
jgi:hypothetical protein